MKYNILTQLDRIEFHDLPVDKLTIETEPFTSLTVDFSLYDEVNNKYKNLQLIFQDIIKLNTDNLILNNNSSLELDHFSYELKHEFNCKIQFLLGFGQPSFQIELSCKAIKLNYLDR